MGADLRSLRLRLTQRAPKKHAGYSEACKRRLIAVVRAANNGVRRLLPFECLSAPRARSSAATSDLLQLTARRRGVSPTLSRTSTAAPQSNNASAISLLPRRAAMCSAVQCLAPSQASTVAPAWISARTTSAPPGGSHSLATEYSGV